MSPAEKRIEDLEIKVAFQEKQIADLDEVLRDQRTEVDALRRALEALTDAVERTLGAPDDEGGSSDGQ